MINYDGVQQGKLVYNNFIERVLYDIYMIYYVLIDILIYCQI